MTGAAEKLKRLRPWIAAAAFALAAFLVYRALQPYSVDEIMASLRSISPRHVALGLAFTAGSFLCISASDTLAVRYTNRSQPYPRIALASFTSVSIGHALGFAALSSGALRYRFYTAWGLSRGDVGRIMVFCGLTATLGMATLAGIASAAKPALLADSFRVAEGVVAALGVLLLLAVAVYLALAAWVRRPIRIRRFELPVPRLPLALGQIAVGTADMLLVSAVLHQLLSASADVHYLAIATAYVSGNIAAVVAHVPGGLGVVEAVILSLVPGAQVIGALIAFRAIYYLLPFAIGCLTLVLVEVARRRREPLVSGSLARPDSRAAGIPCRRRGGSPR